MPQFVKLAEAPSPISTIKYSSPALMRIHACAAPGEANGGPEPQTRADNASSGRSVAASFTALFNADIIILS